MVSHMKVLSKKQENYFTVGKVGKQIDMGSLHSYS